MNNKSDYNIGLNTFSDMLLENISGATFLPGFAYGMLNFSTDGTLLAYCIMPDISEQEVKDFLKDKNKFYNYDINNTITATLIRGPIECDQVINVSYPDNRVDLFRENKRMLCIMVDTTINKIVALKLCFLPEKVCNTLVENINKINTNQISQDTITKVTYEELYTRSPEQLEKLGRYIGQETHSIVINDNISCF